MPNPTEVKSKEVEAPTIKRIEKMTKIKIDQTADFIYDLSKINNDVFKSYRDDIKKLKPLHHANDIYCLLREDKEGKSLTKVEALQNAGASKDGYFISPKPYA